ncbi:hypothetical protein AX774_g1894 [Zancudomyces culisetae]|uniref:Nuclear pore complex protein Nup85 n=1 Tax=Zancudomyces culisetae TaxID=1213189 RepID=A0A1R1PUA1_ZANCU|nr:hypothetical protein AX774_g1894 [Zancudomyces culisetae]|eukprot:OMH84565.1 hypothetical protein AX774_g1894 [Zancudomyces culisetae]
MILETIQNLILALHEYSDIRELVGKTTVAGVVDIQETKRLSRAHKLWYQKLQLLDSSISIVEFTGFEWIKLATGVLVGDKSRIALVTETWIEAMVAGLYYFNVNVSKIDLAQQANWYLKSRLVTEDLTSMSLISDKLINLLVESKYDAFVRLCYKVDMWFGVHIHQFVSALEPILNYSENSELASLRLKTLEKYADCIALKYGNTPMWSTTLDYYYNSGVLAKFQLVISSQPVDSEVALNNLLMICDSFESPTLKVSILKKWILYCLNNVSSNHIHLALTSLSLLAPLSNHCDFVYLVFLKTLHLFINSENTLHVANQIFSLCSITDTEKAQIITSDFFIDQLIRISEFYISQSYPSLLLLLDVNCSESRYSGIPTSHSSNSEFSFDSSGPNLIWILVFIELLKSYTGLSHFPCLSLSSKAQLQDIKSKAQSILNYYYFIHNSTPNTDTESKNKKKELDFVFSPKFSYSKVGEMIRLFIDLV